MKKQLTFALIALIAVVGGLFHSCSKESTSEDQLTLKAAKVATALTATATDLNALNCANCASTWQSTEVSSSKFYKITGQKVNDVTSVTITASNDVDYVYFKVSTATETFAQISINSIWTKFDTPVSKYEWKVAKTSWNACDNISVNLELQGLSGTGYCTGTFSYSMRELCTTTTLTSDKENPVCANSPVILTATVSAGEAIKGGTLNIYKDKVLFATAQISENNKTVVAEYLPKDAGSANFTASYSGSTGYKASTTDAPTVVTAQVCTPPPTSTCKENFTVQNNDDNSYTFTYTPAIDKRDAFLEFTFPQGVIITAPEGWNYPGNSKTSVVRQTHADLTACSPFSFKFILTHTENGSGPLWTDFKVDGVKKN